MANNVQRSAPPRPAARPANSSPAQNRAAGKPGTQSQAGKPGPQGPAQSNQPGNLSRPGAPVQDKFKPSAEMRENQSKEMKPGGCTKSENGGGKPESKPQDPGQQVASDPAWDKLEGQVSDIQRQLDGLRQGQKPGCAGGASGKCDGGGASQGKRGGSGCSGGAKPAEAKPPEESSAAEKAKEDDKKDPDSELQKLAVAALTAVAMAQAGQSQQQGQPGQSGGGNPAEIKNQLRSKCDQLKGQGFQPKGETRAVVSAALGGDPFGSKGSGAPSGAPAPAAPGTPNTAISPPLGSAPDLLSGLRRTA